MNKKALPTYKVVWDRWRGKYAASSSERPSMTVIDVDPFAALADLRKLIMLLR